MSTIREGRQTARKEYACIWCGEGIAKGATYFRWVGTNDGDLQSNAFHLECEAAAQEYMRDESRADPDDGFPPWEGVRGEPRLR